MHVVAGFRSFFWAQKISRMSTKQTLSTCLLQLLQQMSIDLTCPSLALDRDNIGLVIWQAERMCNPNAVHSPCRVSPCGTFSDQIKVGYDRKFRNDFSAAL